ncbi:hypothetical protein N658DRAFT_55029 [Parathielavia hyrcaniae]|uniref:Uncharacterized protein n=1 Tax=Parathielavia hyrcaniae TaxID=113614 RepID=A0AAN6PR10_9PEZI|nr:hypothetical protein N658DRAFT_55029 [Parathielavia hyrcaniae]
MLNQTRHLKRPRTPPPAVIPSMNSPGDDVPGTSMSWRAASTARRPRRPAKPQGESEAHGNVWNGQGVAPRLRPGGVHPLVSAPHPPHHLDGPHQNCPQPVAHPHDSIPPPGRLGPGGRGVGHWSARQPAVPQATPSRPSL